MSEYNEYKDIELVCPCGNQFTFTTGEQEFLNDLFVKGKIDRVSQPKRCASCRQKKKEERARQENQVQY